MITEYTDIQKQFNRVLSFSQGIPFPQTDKIFADWAKAKEHIYKAFGDTYIYEVPEKVEFKLGATERETRVIDFIGTVCRVYKNGKLGEFLEGNLQDFYDNKTNKDYIAPDGTKIQAGTKIIKAFKYFEQDESTLAQLQSMASMIIQTDKVEGKLCFSIHPLDYLSLSENTYNWRSCHALDGDYRAGNLSYMCDKVTIVCYLKGEEEAHLPRFPQDITWNSKKWRMLLTYDKESGIMFAGRQYPFFNETILDIIMPYLHKALRLSSYHWSSWHNDTITNWTYKNGKDNCGIYKSVPIAEMIYPLYQLIHDVKPARGEVLHFNDLLRSSCYSPYYCWDWTRWHSKTPKIEVGSTPVCICCGEEELDTGEWMVCASCRQKEEHELIAFTFVCEHCGVTYDLNESRITKDGSFVCLNCINNGNIIKCPICEGYVFSDSAIWDRERQEYICADCAERIENNG